MKELCQLKGVNWNDFETKKKRGRLIVKEYYLKNGAKRSRWTSIAPSIFTQNRVGLSKLIPIQK